MPSLDLSIDKQTRKDTGSHYTPQCLSDFVASQILDEYERTHANKTRLKILDPAVGDGELLNSILKLCVERGFTDISVTGFDINNDAIKATEKLLSKYKKHSKISLQNEDFLDWVLEGSQNNLFSSSQLKYYDVVIANPPYVRTQVMGSDKAKDLASQFNLSGRIDLYHAFIIAIEKILDPKGIVGIIVSNRFLTTKSGESVREHLKENFDITHIWDFGDTKLFKAAVLPAVLLMHKGEQKNDVPTNFSSVYLNGKNAVDPEEVFLALESSEETNSLKVTHGILNNTDNPKEVWSVSNTESDSWLNQVDQNTKFLFSDIGKVKVGVKTTADKVFIVKNDHEFEKGNPEKLAPLTTHHIARRFKANDPQKKIVYTHENVDGKKTAINLNSYPKTKDYLEKHFDTLDGRNYVKKSNRNWYEIWVPHNPSDWEKPKLVFRDISEKPIFWFDEGGSVINGDCYWMTTTNNNLDDYLWLALGVANSKFIEEFYDRKFNNKLYSGRRRFITQYVEKFPLPDLRHETSSKIVRTVKEIYKQPVSKDVSSYEEKLDNLVYKAFGF